MGHQYPLVLSSPFVWALFILTRNFSFHDAMLVYQLTVPALTEISYGGMSHVTYATCLPATSLLHLGPGFQKLFIVWAAREPVSVPAPIQHFLILLQCFFELLFVFFLMTLWAWQATCAAQGSFRGFNSPASDVSRFTFLWT